jgi:predicted metalloendopeptidase
LKYRLLPAYVAIALSVAVPLAAADAPAASVGIDLAGMDRSVKPGDDFFRYANGTWLKTTEIPADRGSYSVGWIVTDRNNQRTVDLIQQVASGNAADGSPERKIGDYYATFMDLPAIEAQGIRPLQPALERIAAIKDVRDLSRVLGGSIRADVDAFNATNYYTDNIFGVWIAQDVNDETRYVPYILQGGLDMPDRDYYVDPSPRMVEIRDKHKPHIAAMLKLAGIGDAEARAARIFDLERRIAEAHWTREDSENIKKTINPWTRRQFDTAAPGIDWTEFFAAAELAGRNDFMVWQPSAVTGISALVASQPLQTWKDYLAFHAIEHAASVLPDAFGQEAFAFHGTVLGGAPQRTDRWKRAVASTNVALGEAVGRLYTEKYFPPAAKARLEEMVRNIAAAFSRRIDALTWMAPETRAQAKAKLAVLKVGVGYPDSWRDYGNLRIVRGDAYGNLQRAEIDEYRRNLAKLGQPVDRSEWVMTPQTVNAVNLPAMNAMNFPAGILQPPYFDLSRPVAMDYGAIGAIIGHEIVHSFDDQGAQFDARGRLRNWWTEDDLAHFRASSQKLVAQYDAYKPLPDLALNGKLTLSENIADVAGLSAAYDAYRMSLGGRPAPVVAGLTGDQQFFIAYAQSWRGKSREASLRRQVLGDSHSPSEFRVATVRNLDPWYEAFDVKPGQRMYLAPADRIRIW